MERLLGMWRGHKTFYWKNRKRPFGSGLQMETLEQGQIRIARIESDVLKRSGAELQTVKRSSPEQAASRIPPNIQVRKRGSSPALPSFIASSRHVLYDADH